MSGRQQKVWLNGVDLLTVHPAILIQHINESDLKLNQKWMDRAGGFQVLTGNAPQRKEIVIEFAIRDGRDFTRRTEAYTAVCAWAYSGGWLEVSNRPGKKIYVQCSEMPALGKLRDWTENLSIHFVAGWYPFWQETVPMIATATGVSSGLSYLTVPGNWPSNLDATITPTANLSSVSLEVDENGTELALTGMNITANTPVHIRHTEQHILCIDANGVDLMQYRTGSDDLILPPGMATINYQFSTACNVTFSAGGAWL